jgi:hypothetical protein
MNYESSKQLKRLENGVFLIKTSPDKLWSRLFYRYIIIIIIIIIIMGKETILYSNKPFFSKAFDRYYFHPPYTYIIT